MITSIIVLYNPDIDIFVRLEKLAKASDKVIVILNQANLFGKTDLTIENSEFIILGENIGLAKALNIGIKSAMNDSSCNYIALFDQDSILLKTESITEISKYFLMYSKLKIALIGHNNVDIKLKNVTQLQVKSIVEVDDIITSGSVIPCEVLREVGLMDENLFIDYIDYEWCLRAKFMGYKIYKSNNYFIEHNLGDEFINFIGFKKPLHNNQMRKFYIIRNNLILMLRNYIPLSWKIKHFIKLCYRVPGYILYSNNKIDSIKIIYNSISDFVNNRIIYKNYKY